MEGYFGKYRAKVADVGDPDKMARIKVIVPALFGSEIILDAWAYPVLPFAGKSGDSKYGAWNPPVVGDWVYVEFEMGDPNYPIYTGYWWGEGEMPDDFKPGNVYGLITPNGSRILVKESGGNTKIEIESAGGVEIEAKASDVNITAHGKVNLQGPGGRPIARVGDGTAHTCVMSGAPVLGKIASGSDKATSG